jgi:hypothetical protein
VELQAAQQASRLVRREGLVMPLDWVVLVELPVEAAND